MHSRKEQRGEKLGEEKERKVTWELQAGFKEMKVQNSISFNCALFRAAFHKTFSGFPSSSNHKMPCMYYLHDMRTQTARNMTDLNNVLNRAQHLRFDTL